MRASGTTRRPDHFVQSLERGLSVIRCFDADHPDRSLTDVAEATGLSRAAARRFLLTLLDLGYVDHHEGRYSLTPRVLELGYGYLSSQTLPELVQPHLERLTAAVGESSSVSVRDDTEIVYIARVATSRIMAVAITVGTRFPAYCTSMGRVLLAALDDDTARALLAASERTRLTARTATDVGELMSRVAKVREDGYAIVDQELDDGLRSVAVPVTGATGRTVAAINLSTQANRHTLDAVRRVLLPELQSTAAAISDDLARRSRARPAEGASR